MQRAEALFNLGMEVGVKTQLQMEVQSIYGGVGVKNKIQFHFLVDLDFF